LSGNIVSEFSEFEQEKWEHIEGFGTDIGGTWIRFKGSSLVQGEPLFIYDLLFAHVNEEGDMHGVLFNDYLGTSIPQTSFELLLIDT
jgi:hypothetical protein